MMLAASSASGSGQYWTSKENNAQSQCLYFVVCEKIFDLHFITLLASTRQASASCTLALSRSVAFIRDPLIIVHDND